MRKKKKKQEINLVLWKIDVGNLAEPGVIGRMSEWTVRGVMTISLGQGLLREDGDDIAFGEAVVEATDEDVSGIC